VFAVLCRLQLAQLVVQQWLWFTHSRRRQQLAVQHHNRQLMAAGMLAACCSAVANACLVTFVCLGLCATQSFKGALQVHIHNRTQDLAPQTGHAGQTARLRCAVIDAYCYIAAAGWLALQQEVSQQQLLLCQANLQAAKLSFLQLSRCFVAWQQLLRQRQRLAAAAAGVQARQQRQLLSAALLGWQEAVLQGRLQRQLLLRGEAYRVVMVMSRALQGWRGWLADTRLKRLKHSR
jgi:hypothetical protein